ncbi:MAG: alkaline phosphatase family protein [Pseudomonadales bacterium]|nr:alkaline phosphatase family protein [Pseudomonadales bacterium]
MKFYFMKSSFFIVGASLAAALLAPGAANAQNDQVAAEVQSRLIFVTIDGVRWQEIYHGAAERIVDDPRRTPEAERIRKDYLPNDQLAVALTPFLHSLEAKNGLLLGNRDKNYCMRVGNRYWFSYPGYNEMLTGRTDTWANTNDPIVNPDITILEWVNHLPGYAGKVRAYATWNNFRNILNQKRSGIAVNDPDTPLPEVAYDNADARTQALALQSLKHEDPRVLFVGFGQTDEYAHEGRYDHYLDALHAADGYIKALWDAVQADPRWAGNTTLIVTTDHGRGLADFDNENWRRHSSGIDAEGLFHPEDSWPGSDQTWAAYLGPRPVEPTSAPVPQLWPCPTTSQLAATALEALGLQWRDFNPKMNPPLLRLLE